MLTPPTEAYVACRARTEMSWLDLDIRVFAFWMQCMSPDAECQGKCLLDDACHGICLQDEECQGICLLDAACVLQMQSVKADVVRTRGIRGICRLNAARVLQAQNVKANVFWTTYAMASAFKMRSVSAFAFWTQCMSYRCRVSIQMSSWPGVSGYLPSGRSAYLQTKNLKANVFWMLYATASAFQMRSVTAFAFWTQCVSYRCRVSRQMSSGRGVSGHLRSERSACLTDAEYQGKFLPDAECQGKCRPDHTYHGICLLDEECLRHTDAACRTDAECQRKWQTRLTMAQHT